MSIMNIFLNRQTLNVLISAVLIFILYINKTIAEQLQLTDVSSEKKVQETEVLANKNLKKQEKCPKFKNPTYFSMNYKGFFYLFGEKPFIFLEQPNGMQQCIKLITSTNEVQEDVDPEEQVDEKAKKEPKKVDSETIVSAAVDPLGRYLAIAEPRRVLVYSLESNNGIEHNDIENSDSENEEENGTKYSANLEIALSNIETRVQSMEFHPNGESLLIGGSDGQVYHWYFQEQKAQEEANIFVSFLNAKNKILERYYGHSAVVSSVAFHPYGKSFYSADWNGVLSAWRPYREDSAQGVYDRNKSPRAYFADSTNRVVASREGAEEIVALKFLFDGELLVLATGDGMIEGWKIRGFKKVFSTKAHKGVIFDLAVSNIKSSEAMLCEQEPCVQEIATVGRDGFGKKWNIKRKNSENSLEEYTIENASEQKYETPRKITFNLKKELVVVDAEGEIFRP